LKKQSNDDLDVAFIEYLYSHVEGDTRGMMAALRRGLGTVPGTAPEMHKYVLPILGNNAPRWKERAYYLVGSLFAWHQIPWKPAKEKEFSNLGTSLAMLKTEENDDALERRFIALLNSHADDLHVHLRQVIRLLKDVRINWLQLLKDLEYWESEKRYKQKQWAKEFWTHEQKSREPEAMPQDKTGEGS